MQGFDIGPQTIEMYKEELRKAKTVLWNGPLGLFEFDQFATGTNEIAKCLAELNDCKTIIGGGDSAAAVNKAGLAEKMRQRSFQPACSRRRPHRTPQSGPGS